MNASHLTKPAVTPTGAAPHPDEGRSGVGGAPTPDSGKRRGIQSIEIGFEIVDVLAKAARPLALRTIAERCGMPVANVHNYLVSFQKVGLAVQDRESGHYGLGPYALKLGVAAISQFDLHNVARPAMADLCAQTAMSVFLGVWGNKGPTIVYRVEDTHSAPLMELRVGSVLPVLTSALGRNFLAHLPEHMTASLTKQELQQLRKRAAADRPSDTPCTVSEIETMVAWIREHGVSRCRDSFLAGFTTMSVPVFDRFGNIVAGITIMGSSDAFDGEPASQAAQALRRAGAAISMAAGWHG